MSRRGYPKLTVSGPLAAERLGVDLWKLAGRGRVTSEIYLRGTGADADDLLAGRAVLGASLEWRPEEVLVALTGAEGVRHLKVGTAIVHDPRPAAYADVGLCGFDDAARRFWRRVFLLLRLPGGRLLLGLVARRNSAKQRPASQ